MIKNILVATDGSEYGDVASEYAVFLAQQLKARLIGLHVLDSRMLEGPLMSDISGWIGAQPYGAQLRQFRELLESKGQAVMDALAEKCSEIQLEPELRLKMGHPAQIILEEEVHAELTVLGQRGEHAQWLGEMMGSNAERVARSSVRPCLVTPGAFRPVTKILTAYDGSAHASQALSQAVELAQSLGVELIVLTATEDEASKRAEIVSMEGLKMAEAHGCKAVNLVVEGRAEEAILETAREQECSLIVAGAYGHSRIREMILGSASTFLITHSDLPVMLVR